MGQLEGRIVAVTGASSGIGRACARAFAREGAHLLLLARRLARLRELGRELQGEHGVRVESLELDVRDRAAVARVLGGLGPEWAALDVLVCNAGLSRGLERLPQASLDDWEEMIDTNLKGLLYTSRTVLPGMLTRGRGHVIHLGSIAGREAYPGGNVYCATKAAVRMLTRALKIDLLGTPVRVSSIDPGLVRTEFSEVRFHGDVARAEAVYQDLEPLTPEDVAEAVVWVASRPARVNVLELLLLPTAQASANHVHRGPLSPTT